MCKKNSTQVTITTWPANAPIKQMKFVLNRILSKTQAISIVFLRRQINTKNKTNKNQILRILISTLPLIVKFNLLFLK